MPPSSPTTADNILEYTLLAANALRDVSAAAQIPFLSRVCTLSMAIIPMVQNTKFQKDRCLRITEDIHHLLCALIGLCVQSEDIQSPKVLDQVAQYAVTLHRFHSCLRTLQDLGTLKRLFKRSEITRQLDSCGIELTAALSNLSTNQSVGIGTALVEFDIQTERRHQELLELITSQSDTLDTLSSVGRSSMNTSSGLLSLLPASPEIFNGREAELQDLVTTLLAEPARIAILGPGGMGKTTLAMAALHDPRVMDRYHTCYFIPCDSAHTSDSLVAIIASHLGIDTSHASRRAVIHHLSATPSCLLVLDNFETPWEPLEDRAKVEDFLSLLTDVPYVALLITMRGAERPSKVRWTRPFLQPLTPLARLASHQTFIEIADEIHDDSEVDQPLDITDNVPLAIQLVATIADSEGCQATLERWKIERTALLSAGYDKRSNLEISIMLSLSSPRMRSSPHAAELLSLMSLLSDGILDIDLTQSRLPLPDMADCKTTLVRTSLVYFDHTGRFKVLAPIREYIKSVRPPSPVLVRSLRNHLNDLLKLWRTAMDRSSLAVDFTPRLVSNLGNLHNVLLYGLDSDAADLRESIRGIILLNELNLRMNRGLTPLMLRLPEILAGIDDHELHGQFITGALKARHFYTLPNLERSIAEATEHFRIIKDFDGEARLYNATAEYHSSRFSDLKKAEKFYHRAMSLTSECISPDAHARSLAGLAAIECLRGNYSEGLRWARETHRIALSMGNVAGEFNGLRWQAMCYNALGDFKRSMQLLGEGRELIFRVLGCKPQMHLVIPRWNTCAHLCS
ncbi:hypothetical protein K438DRAFT_1861994 [Mycena galopus ATCC 62051]|nr:hypothetical protein K438DRAFT_1861994 [Mycena galopus ATCC 62051]